ncbi:MAG: DNA mismatch repair endonuclease MutL [Pseudomonadota bacterium]
MTQRIHVLPEWLKNQIAAGEVIERPASVVKELVENSLDAGSTHIVVEIDGGGGERIRVVDNGHGMSAEDARTSLERHATSKLRSMDDLKRIRTLGFRGEALPSIASVSRFVLKTRERPTDGGVAIGVTGGRELTTWDVGMPPGTDIVVEDLFYNVPARRKFLKKPATEAGAITEVIQRVALGHPSVHFTLVVDGRRSIDVPSARTDLERIYGIFGAKVCDHLYECVFQGEISVGGFVSAPTLTKSSRTGIFTYVNGRFIRDRVIQHALSAGYGALLPRGRHPVAIIEVTVPPELVDVNVHPTKSEVRFVNSGAVHSAVSRAVSLTLADTPWLEEGQSPAGSATHVAESRGWVPGARPTPARYNTAKLLEEMHRSGAVGGEDDFPWEAKDAPSRETADPQPTARSPQPVADGVAGFYTAHRYIGQFGGCFLLLERDGELVIIDQHAAHERVLYERFRARWVDKRPDIQRLLVPHVVDLPPHLAALLTDRCQVLERLGFLVDPFGGNSFAVKGVPPDLCRLDPEGLLNEVAEQMAESGVDRADSLEGKWDHIFATMACKAAIKAGDPIAPEEVRSLLAQMEETRLSTYCPHGRPAVARFSVDQVGRWFHR